MESSDIADILETAELLVEPFAAMRLAAMRFILDGLLRSGPVGGMMMLRVMVPAISDMMSMRKYVARGLGRH